MKDFVIRNPKDEDVEKFEKLDFVLKMLYLYHGDFDKRNMFCAVNGEDELLAVAHLMKHGTFNAAGHDGDPDFIRYLNYEITFAKHVEDEAVKAALTDALIRRSREIKAENPEKRIVMAQYIDTDNLKELSYFLARGFTIHDTIVVFKFDLSRDIPRYPLPEDVRVVPFALNNSEALEKYHQAELASFDGVARSMNHLGWMQGGPEMTNFCAFSGEQLIGNTSTWKVTEERSVTENVFVIPDWQKKGVARNMICTALTHLKQQGKTIATLGTHGTNRKAISLYTQIGYELYGFRLTIGYEIE
ncbi:ribosomal protein S18 acetylase RimI-like enzyme [Paenibacillus forsythiae]|uniref:Ribosomal protein S18 acetylase RimI-like enzyme n=1 Tax=Paenibacillus forsythiae TaxID=365616 RepID=A0ABU3HAF1_9BACL|nr:GNAT family N-acetyltransferase [Paenibacillus forsythiae]MDT3427788.1 ribosomal protein S18 acetylase RimI-like enzyme [Paenibacillus forsythiae]